MRGNWIEFVCFLLTDLEGKNQDRSMSQQNEAKGA